MSHIFGRKISVLGQQFFQHGKASFYRRRCGLRILKHVIHSRWNILPFHLYYFRNVIVLHSFFNVLVDVTSVFTEAYAGFSKGGAENLRIMKTRMKIFQPKTKSVFQPKLGEDQKKKKKKETKGLHSNLVQFLAKKRSSPTVSVLKPSAQVTKEVNMPQYCILFYANYNTLSWPNAPPPKYASASSPQSSSWIAYTSSLMVYFALSIFSISLTRHSYWCLIFSSWPAKPLFCLLTFAWVTKIPEPTKLSTITFTLGKFFA